MTAEVEGLFCLPGSNRLRFVRRCSQVFALSRYAQCGLVVVGGLLRLVAYTLPRPQASLKSPWRIPAMPILDKGCARENVCLRAFCDMSGRRMPITSVTCRDAVGHVCKRPGSSSAAQGAKRRDTMVVRRAISALGEGWMV